MLAVAVNCEFVSSGSGNRQVLQPQVDVGVTKSRYCILADDLMGGFRLEDNFAFRSPEFHGERVLAFGVEANLRKKPKGGQGRAKSTTIKRSKIPIRLNLPLFSSLTSSHNVARNSLAIAIKPPFDYFPG